MKRFYLMVALFTGLISLTTPLYAMKMIHHNMQILIDPEKSLIKVEDKISIDKEFAKKQKLTFRLHKKFNPVSATPEVKIFPTKTPSKPPDFNINSTAKDKTLEPRHYEIIMPADTQSFTLKYKGPIYHPIKRQVEEYARSFGETPGLISPKGIYLGGTTCWYPKFDDDLLTFTLDVKTPKSWTVVSQGKRTKQSEDKEWEWVRWESAEPQEEIYLVGGKFTEYNRVSEGVQAMVFLRQPDEQLANKYLDTTVQYISMYNQLLGPYPYKKFALVENFWETGYGMPSFTLLGPKVIRFPFILHSSYPHEILHNWWGNGVFVDYQKGNWCEGLTSYLADHLIKEQRGKGTEYRQTTLQHYTDYVRENKDFPLTEFRSRHSSVTQAVGYGKTLMLFHMLRMELGDDVFVRSLQRFYQDNKFRQAAFDDLQTAFTKVSGKELDAEFSQWIDRAGAPKLHIEEVNYKREGSEYILNALIKQVQPGSAYKLLVPITVYMKDGKTPYRDTFLMGDKRLKLSLRLPTSPLRLDVDPEFDLFRRLHRNEIPPALSQAFGADEVLIILPAAAAENMKAEYRKLAASWKKSKSGKIEIKFDHEINELPANRVVWLFGWENRFRYKMDTMLGDYEASIHDTQINIKDYKIDTKNHSFVFTARNPANQDNAVVWVMTDNIAAIPGLGRKLPHYRKYSYLVFEGNEPSIMLKGQWPTVNSPMSVLIPQEESSLPQNIKTQLSSRKALAYLPPVFSENRMLETIQFLSSDSLKGRGFGTPELDKAADFIARKFREAGLEPAGDKKGSYFQVWKDRWGNPEREVLLKNIIGIIPGRKKEWAKESIVIGAHYDHLGLGWPDVKKENEGKVHPGADDNASGIAVLLELANQLGRKWKPDRTVVFIAFTGEEARRRGSFYYVQHEKNFPAKKCIAMLNIDTVGRLGEKKLMILGIGSAREWIHIFNGASYVTGVPIDPVLDDFGSSDHKSFIDIGVPAVQLFSGPHTDYHSPGDTIDKIDPAGLVKTAAVIKEAVEYLAGRDGPLSSTLTIQNKNVLPPQKSKQERKVTFGTIPDFTYTGKGYKIIGVSPNSPAEKAGLKNGDVIIRINNAKVDSLSSFSRLLKTLKPGDPITVIFLRNDIEHKIKTKLIER